MTEKSAENNITFLPSSNCRSSFFSSAGTLGAIQSLWELIANTKFHARKAEICILITAFLAKRSELQPADAENSRPIDCLLGGQSCMKQIEKGDPMTQCPHLVTHRLLFASESIEKPDCF